MTISRLVQIAPDKRILKGKIHEHELWLRDKSKYEKGDFSYFDFNDYKISPDINIFEFRNLSEADFRKSKVSNLEFTGAILRGTDFRGANYDFLQFSEEQKKEAIFTDKDYQNYLEKKKLEEENISLKNMNVINEKTLENITEEKTEKLVSGFEKLQEEFSREERLWLIISILTFFILFGLSFIIFLDSFFYQSTIELLFTFIGISISFLLLFFIGITRNNSLEKKSNKSFWEKFNFKNIKETTLRIVMILYSMLFVYILQTIGGSYIATKSVFGFEHTYYAIFPLSLLLFSFLYFSIYQYSKAKNLRIENQNKVTLLYGFEAIKSDSTPDINKPKFYDKIADEVFKGVFEEKNNGGNLPIDKVIDIITSFKK